MRPTTIPCSRANAPISRPNRGLEAASGGRDRLAGAARVSCIAAVLLAAAGATSAFAAPQLVCRKVVAETATGEGRNTAEGSRVKCSPGEMLTGGTCYADTRPEEDGSCQTSAMGIIQQIVDYPQTTEAAFFTCLQTGGSDCPVSARTRAMAICCKIAEPAEAEKK